ncbi:MAG TPA: ABC transporter permease [Pyrinomonadaceae bacterium]
MDQASFSLSRLLTTLWQDISYGVRQLHKNSGFTAVAVLTLALGIGANTAIFSIINSILLRPLPFKDPDRLVLVWQTNPNVMDTAPTSYANMMDWKEQNRVFEDMAAWASYPTTKFSLIGTGDPEQIQYALGSANLFGLLGVTPAIGRAFTAEEDKPGGEKVVMLSHALWQRRFGGDKTIIGKPLTLDNGSYTVVGVLPASFKFVSFPKEADVWIPITADPEQYKIHVRSLVYLGVIARLKPGVTPEDAGTNMSSIARNISQENPDSRNWDAKVVTLQKQVVGEIRPALLILLGAVGFVLLIACANVANLLLARATGRHKEIAIRAAMGASRGRLIRQLLTESLLLSFVGGVVGLLLALWGTFFLARLPFSNSSMFVPYSATPDQVGIDLKVLGYTLLISLFTGLIFGLAPALQISKLDQYKALKEGGSKGGGSRRNRSFRSLLVVSEVALSLILLIGAGLLIKGFLSLQKVDPGFNPNNVLTLNTSLPRSTYQTNEMAARFYEQLLERVQALPGVKAAGAVTVLPFSNSDEGTGFYIEGQPKPDAGQGPLLHQRIISPGYFQAMGVGVRNGREFDHRDRADGQPTAIINETMARRFWPNQNPIGKRLALTTEVYQGGKFNLDAAWREVVGVVGDVRHFGLASEPVAEAYIALPQSPEREMTVVIRTSSDPLALAPAVRREVASIDKDQPVANIRTMDQIMSESLARPRFSFLLLTIFAGVALVLSAVGVYGVMSYSVGQRTHEYGIRMALGAQTRDMFTLVLKEGFMLAIIGIGVGIAGALALTHYLRSLLFGISATDPVIFVSISLMLIAITLLACYIPARRAMRVDPMVALRYE